MERSGNLREVILLLGEWLQSHESYKDTNDPAFIEKHNRAAQIADQARYLLVDLEQIKQFVQEGETQRKERDQLQQ